MSCKLVGEAKLREENAVLFSRDGNLRAILISKLGNYLTESNIN